MIKNYFKIALRSIGRSKVHTLINVVGLSLGVACCTLIVLFVRDEWTFDTFHTKSERIYRVYVKENWGENQEFFNTVTPFPMGPALLENIPEVEKQVRINNISTQVKSGEDQFNETVTIGGRDFFDVFDFMVVMGEKDLLRDPRSVVLTRRTAKKYFGESNPIDRVISMQLGENFEDFTVKAVVENIPSNSSVRFSLLISDLNYPKLYSEQALTSAWFNVTPETYVLLQAGADPAVVASKFPALFKTILGEDEFTKSHYAPGLQPLTDIHLNTGFPTGMAPVSNPRYSYILAAIALLILVVACINFITLSVGRSIRRGKEVGIRKVVGAQRQQLIYQFIGEAMLITFISLVAGIGWAWSGMSMFNELSGKQLIFPWNGFLVMVSLSLLVIIGLIAGSYPAFVLSGFKPVLILKGHVQAGDSRQQVRKVLVGVQMVLSIFLISSTLIMSRQLEFLQNKDLGFNKEQLAVIPLNVPRGGRLTERVKKGFEQAELFKAEFSKIKGIVASCASAHDFGNGDWTHAGFTDDKGVYQTFFVNVIDDEYIPLMKMELVEGRNFESDHLADVRRGVIINEAFAKAQGWTDAIGKKIPGKNFIDHEVIGVVKDFHYASLYTRVQPLAMVRELNIIFSGIENININNSPIPKLLVRLAPGNMLGTVEQIKTVWQRINEGEEFTFEFVDQALAAQYQSDQNLGRIVRIATLLAILIGSLGLYALASLAMQNRIKEISIRKVLGATEQSLLVLLSKDYIYLIATSLIVSVPITVYLMTNWLRSFEYRVAIGWQVFALAGLLSLAIAMITICYQTIKTAWTRPAETLKYE
jgi:putative ABC transport system permease protein